MTDEKKVIRDYVIKVRRCFTVYGRYEKEYLAGLTERLSELSLRVSDFSEEDIVREFGTPSDIAADYYSSVDEAYFVKKLRTARLRKLFLTVVVVAAFFSVVFSKYMLYLDYQDQVQRIERNHLDLTIEPDRDNWFAILMEKWK